MVAIDAQLLQHAELPRRAELLLRALAAKDAGTAEHSAAVMGLARFVGKELGLNGEDLRDLELVALLHDIGKVAMPDSILKAPRALTDAEWSVMRRHPEVGQWILAAKDDLLRLARAVRAEHERWDGRGYPDGMRGEEIPLSSRIVFVVDAFHAMISDRPYSSGRDADSALEEIERGLGGQFCPVAGGALVGALS